MNQQSNEQPCSEPGKADAEQGMVVLDGPNGVAVTLTPDAAEKTGQSLIEAASKALRQQADEAQ